MKDKVEPAPDNGDRSDHTHGERGVHPGWALTPQSEYDLGLSGGWGTPGQHLTGPIPKLRRTLRPHGPGEQEHDQQPDAPDAMDDTQDPDPSTATQDADRRADGTGRTGADG